MTETTRPLWTNGDELAAQVRGRLEWAAAHPDELAAAAVPVLAIAIATRRHRLTWPESWLLAQAGVWAGLYVCQQYRQWKARPAGGRDAKR